MALHQSELDVANKEIEVAEAKLQLARAEQEAAKFEADALSARVEAKRILEELKQTKAKIAQEQRIRMDELLDKSTSDPQEQIVGVQQMLQSRKCNKWK